MLPTSQQPTLPSPPAKLSLDNITTITTTILPRPPPPQSYHDHHHHHNLTTTTTTTTILPRPPPPQSYHNHHHHHHNLTTTTTTTTILPRPPPPQFLPLPPRYWVTICSFNLAFMQYRQLIMKIEYRICSNNRRTHFLQVRRLLENKRIFRG